MFTLSSRQRDQTLCMQWQCSPRCGEGWGYRGRAAKTWLRTIKDSLALRRPWRRSLCHCTRLSLPVKEQTTRILSRCLVLGVVLLPAMLFAVVAWQDRKSVLNAAERDVLGTVEIFKENAHNVFGTHKLVATLLNGYT
jgi:hypothetical protein